MSETPDQTGRSSVAAKLSKSLKPVRLALLSDTHGLHREVNVPMGDILIHAGDVSWFGKSPSNFEDFDAWLGELPHRHKILVPGNHDEYLEDPQHRSVIRNAHVLVDEGIELLGLKIWGSPVTPLSFSAFGIGATSDRRKHWDKIPGGIDILITHGPSLGVLDVSPGQSKHLGDEELANAIASKAPRLCVFGHIHGAWGTAYGPNTVFVNACLAGEEGELDHQPLSFEIRPAGAQRRS
jgi:Icc-related predicted phosphoesterase